MTISKRLEFPGLCRLFLNVVLPISSAGSLIWLIIYFARNDPFYSVRQPLDLLVVYWGGFLATFGPLIYAFRPLSQRASAAVVALYILRLGVAVTASVLSFWLMFEASQDLWSSASGAILLDP